MYYCLLSKRTTSICFKEFACPASLMINKMHFNHVYATSVLTWLPSLPTIAFWLPMSTQNLQQGAAENYVLQMEALNRDTSTCSNSAVAANEMSINSSLSNL